jgi:hypothetical protein
MIKLILFTLIASYTPKYQVGDCIHELVSNAVIRINKVESNKYFYTVYDFGFWAEESRNVEEFDNQDNIEICKF